MKKTTSLILVALFACAPLRAAADTAATCPLQAGAAPVLATYFTNVGKVLSAVQSSAASSSCGAGVISNANRGANEVVRTVNRVKDYASFRLTAAYYFLSFTSLQSEIPSAIVRDENQVKTVTESVNAVTKTMGDKCAMTAIVKGNPVSGYVTDGRPVSDVLGELTEQSLYVTSVYHAIVTGFSPDSYAEKLNGVVGESGTQFIADMQTAYGTTAYNTCTNATGEF